MENAFGVSGMPQCKAPLRRCLDSGLHRHTRKAGFKSEDDTKIYSRSTLNKRKTQGCTHRMK